MEGGGGGILGGYREPKKKSWFRKRCHPPAPCLPAPDPTRWEVYLLKLTLRHAAFVQYDGIEKVGQGMLKTGCKVPRRSCNEI